MLAESMDIGTVINKKMIAASYIYQLTLDADVLNVRSLSSADAEVVEFIAKPGSKLPFENQGFTSARSGKHRWICKKWSRKHSVW